MGKLLAASLKLRIGITLLGKGLQVIHHGVTHGIGESRFFPIKDIVRKIIPFKSMAQQVFSLAIDVHFLGGVNGEDIADKIQIAEGYAGLQRVNGDTAVSTQHIVHMQLPDPFFRLLLELLR